MAMLDNLVGGRLGNALSGGSNQKNQRKRSKFERTLRIADFFDSNTNSLPADKYSQLGTFEIKAQLEATLGQGDASLSPEAQGRPLIDIQDDAGNNEDGFIKLTHENATGNSVDVVLEKRTEEFRVSTRSERIVMPRATAKQGVDRLEQDEQIGLYFKPDSSDVVSSSKSEMELPVTFYEQKA